MEIEEFNELKEKLEEIKERRNRAEGNIEQIMKQLYDDFGIETIPEADKLSEKLQKEINSDKEKLENCLVEISEMVNWEEL